MTRIIIRATQVITILSAFSWIKVNCKNPEYICISPEKREDFAEHLKSIKSLVIPACKNISKHISIVFEEDLVFNDFDILISSRIDHHKTFVLANAIMPKVIVETGESIGVQPKLYSLRARGNRIIKLNKLKKQFGPKNIVLSPAVSVDCYNLLQVRSLLSLVKIVNSLQSKDCPTNTGNEINRSAITNIFILPYIPIARKKNAAESAIKLAKKKFIHILNKTRKLISLIISICKRFAISGEVLLQSSPKEQKDVINFSDKIVRSDNSDSKQVPGFVKDSVMEKSYIIKSIIAAISEMHCSSSTMIKFHPKNQIYADYILNYINKNIQKNKTKSLIDKLETSLPVEFILMNELKYNKKIELFGYGTNLLASTVFLWPVRIDINLVHASLLPDWFILRQIMSLYFYCFFRVEYLRYRHVKRLQIMLEKSLRAIQS